MQGASTGLEPFARHAAVAPPSLVGMQTTPCPPDPPVVLVSSRPPRGLVHPVRLRRGVYADLPACDDSWRERHEVSLARCVAALRTVPSARGLSHESAALVHGLWLPHPEPDVSLVVTSNPRRSALVLPVVGTGRAGVLLRRRRVRVPQARFVTVNGLPVTDILRTAVDCAFDMPARDSIMVLDSALRCLCRPDRRRRAEAEARFAELHGQLVDEVAAQGVRAGARRARAVAAMASPFAESPGESRARWIAAATGLPAAVLQEPVATAAGVFFPDLAWPRWRVAVEFDGRLKYTEESDLWAEKRRQDALTAAGWRLVRVVWEDLGSPAALGSRLLAAFPDDVARSSQPVPELWA